MIWRKERPAAQVEPKPKGFDDFELRLGDILRGERATLGKSLLDVQRELHIRAAHIAAIENGDLTAFEAPSFVAGFVRSYARYLGMDPEWVYDRFCAEHGFAVGHGMTAGGAAQRAQRQTEPVTAPGAIKPVGFLLDPDPFWRRIEPGALGSITILVVLIGGLGFAGWTVLQEVQRVQVAPADLVPNVVADLNPLVPEGDGLSPTAIDTDPLTAAPGSGAVGQVRIARPQALDVPVLVPRDGPIAAIQPETGRSPATIRTEGAIAEALAGLEDEGLPAAAPLPGEIAAIGGPQVNEQGPPTVQILAVRPSWMRVRAANGAVIFERVLDAGETWTLPATEEPPTLHAGNSGSVYFVIQGQAYGPAAPGANVVRNVELSVAGLREAYQVADLTTDADLAVHVARLLTEPAAD
jgi:cytoskeletal protein RodZ